MSCYFHVIFRKQLNIRWTTSDISMNFSSQTYSETFPHTQNKYTRRERSDHEIKQMF